jgi:hypothetical protein
MTVYCQSEECKYFRYGECGKDSIFLNYDNECDDYESYLNEEEWQKPYWKRMRDRVTKQEYRALYYGKEIEIQGLKFFIDVNSDYAYATEATTGLSVGARCDIENRIDKIKEFLSKTDLLSLESLPIGEYDEITKKVVWKETEE